jgi:hypothetical protein
MRAKKYDAKTPRWLLLIHQLPPKPAYLRVKVSRRLSRLGAVALKNTVYALPHTDATIEDFQWVRREILQDGGEATVLAADLVEGLTDAQVEATFRAARDEDYDALAREAQAVAKSVGSRPAKPEARAALEAELAKLDQKLEELMAIDFFQAGKRAAVVRQLDSLRHHLSAGGREGGRAEKAKDYLARTWVTRTGVHVDRIASAWLIRRFIDPKATFKFVPGQGYSPLKGELRFDMFDAEFTHEGDLCTFEVLQRRFGLGAPGLAPIAELIHDIDLKDSRYGRSETAGVAAVINGLAMRHRDDDERLRYGFELFDQLLPWLSRKAN